MSQQACSRNCIVAVQICDDVVLIYFTGTVPQWLNGNLYRNGPGMLDIGDATFGHWFDGMGLLHKYSIKDGKPYTYPHTYINTYMLMLYTYILTYTYIHIYIHTYI